MPITQITIENFKGIGERVDIPLRPITLLFGANSAGKSTILQALLYLQHLLHGRGAEADRLAVAGLAIDLGGFREFVHRRELDRKLRIGVTVALDDDGLPTVGHVGDDEEQPNAAPELDTIREASLFVDIEWSRQFERPVIVKYVVGLDGVPLAGIQTTPGGESRLDVFNERHPLVAGIGEDTKTEDEDLRRAVSGHLTVRYLTSGVDEGLDGGQALLLGQRELPDFDRGLEGRWSLPPRGDDEELDAKRVFDFYNRAMVGVGRAVLAELDNMRYIGPIRCVPERNFTPLRSTAAGRWADGSGAWDLLFRENDDLNWLDEGAFERLGLGVVPRQERYLEVPVGFSESTAGADQSEAKASKQASVVSKGDETDSFRRRTRVRFVTTVGGQSMSPCDLGVGVSQLVPVVVGALAPGYRILAVEQPELHIHPAVQCKLGDLLAWQVIRNRERTMLLETHSEHLMLRLLRRIRENGEGELPKDAPALTPEDVAVLYVESAPEGMKITELPVTSEGDFDGQWPEGFFEERFDEYA